jgi:hypothetical protein
MASGTVAGEIRSSFEVENGLGHDGACGIAGAKK